MNKYVVIFMCLMVVILPCGVSASSGALKKDSIKTCPNGVTYGYHGPDNHWHVAEKSNVKSGWSAVGEALSGDPCPSGNNSSSKTSTRNSNTSTSTANSNVKPAPVESAKPVEDKKVEVVENKEEVKEIEQVEQKETKDKANTSIVSKKSSDLSRENKSTDDSSAKDESSSPIFGLIVLAGAGLCIGKVVKEKKKR